MAAGPRVEGNSYRDTWYGRYGLARLAGQRPPGQRPPGLGSQLQTTVVASYDIVGSEDLNSGHACKASTSLSHFLSLFSLLGFSEIVSHLAQADPKLTM